MEQLPDDLRPEQFSSLNEVIDYIFREHAALPAFSCFGRTLSYSEMKRLSDRFAAYLQHHTSLKPGDKIAIQLPNLLQFPLVLYGALRAGLVVVNTNPLYTPAEMLYQFQDSGVKAIVILENFCYKLQQILHETQIEKVFVTQLGDLQNPFKRQVMNLGVKYLKKLVPAYQLPGALDFMEVLRVRESVQKLDKPARGNDVAVLLYTGGTTGRAKGAMLSHNNLIANMMQLRSRCLLVIRDKVENIAAPLPLYHSYAFLLHCLAMPFAGNHNILITNPRDLDGLIKLMATTRINGFVGINTLYHAMLRHKDLSKLDFSMMKFCGAGGMAMSTAVTREWKTVTGTEILEGYGLTECSPVVAVNIPGKNKPGTVGPVVPDTEIKLVDDAGNEVAQGQRGELWVRGPQVMLGYWQQPEATAEILDQDGWLRTGDYVEVDADNCISIVDRKKDMILVSGFNVYPNEVEDWVNQHPGVLESAAIGVRSEDTGEAIKLFVVLKNEPVAAADIVRHCKQRLTGYKIPHEIVFVKDLPKSNVGKVLRRELRDK
ncbi:MAG: long-chain fatty acid--CoA ligase [Gammaproteobacteria bacterium]|nr:long-chain fatty acid--CoA ligase [Gammaproteobacteria bacterium]